MRLKKLLGEKIDGREKIEGYPTLEKKDGINERFRTMPLALSGKFLIANASRWWEKISKLLERIGATRGELPRVDPFEDPNERVVSGLTEIRDALNELRDALNELKAELAHNLPQIVQMATLFSTGCMAIGMFAILGTLRHWF